MEQQTRSTSASLQSKIFIVNLVNIYISPQLTALDKKNPISGMLKLMRETLGLLLTQSNDANVPLELCHKCYYSCYGGFCDISYRYSPTRSFSLALVKHVEFILVD